MLDKYLFLCYTGNMNKRIEYIKDKIKKSGEPGKLAIQTPVEVPLPTKYESRIGFVGDLTYRPDLKEGIVLQLHSNGTVTWDVK